MANKSSTSIEIRRFQLLVQGKGNRQGDVGENNGGRRQWRRGSRAEEGSQRCRAAGPEARGERNAAGRPQRRGSGDPDGTRAEGEKCKDGALASAARTQGLPAREGTAPRLSDCILRNEDDQCAVRHYFPSHISLPNLVLTTTVEESNFTDRESDCKGVCVSAAHGNSAGRWQSHLIPVLTCRATRWADACTRLSTGPGA